MKVQKNADNFDELTFTMSAEESQVLGECLDILAAFLESQQTVIAISEKIQILQDIRDWVYLRPLDINDSVEVAIPETSTSASYTPPSEAIYSLGSIAGESIISEIKESKIRVDPIYHIHSPSMSTCEKCVKLDPI